MNFYIFYIILIYIKMSYMNIYNTNQNLNVICRSENVQFYSTNRVLTMNTDGDTIEIKVNNDLIDDETINVTKIIGLNNNLTDLTFLKSFFSEPLDIDSKLKLTNFTNNGTTRGVLVSDENGIIKYILIDSNYINSIDYSKIINAPNYSNSKISTMLVDANLNMQNFYITMNGEATSANMLVPYKQVAQVIKWLQPGQFFDTRVSELLLNQKLYISPYNDLGGAYPFQSTNFQITIPNITIQGVKKSNASQHVLIGSSSNTLTVGNNINCYGVTCSDLLFKCNIISNVFLNQVYDSCQFDGTIVINSSNFGGCFIMFLNCAINNNITINSGFNGSGLTATTIANIFFISCTFKNTITITNNSGINTSLIIENGNRLPSFSISRAIFVGICKTETDSRLYLNTKSPYDSITNTRYLWQSTDIQNINLSQVLINSALNMGANAITTTKTSFNNNELITKGFADLNYAASILPTNNTFTGQNFFNLPNDFISNFQINLTGSALSDVRFLEVKNKKIYLNSYSGSGTGYGYAALNDTYLGHRTVADVHIGGVGTTYNNGSLFCYARSTGKSAQMGFNGSEGSTVFYVMDNEQNQFIIENTYTGTTTIPSGMRYITDRFPTTDTFSKDLIRLQNSTTRSGSFFTTNVTTNIGATEGNIVRIGPQSGTREGDTFINSFSGVSINTWVWVGGSPSGTGSARVRIGFDEDAPQNTTSGITSRNVIIGCSRTNSRGVQFYCSNGLFYFADGQANFGGAGSSNLNAVTGTLSANSSLTYKMNIINKSNEYIYTQAEPIKNYYEKIINCPIYTFNYKNYNNTGPCPEILQSVSWEYVYENFYHASGWTPTIENPIKPDASYFDDSTPDKKKTIQKGALLDYVILALQEQDKFIIKPLKQKYEDLENKYNNLENKYNNLISFLKSYEILPSNYI